MSLGKFNVFIACMIVSATFLVFFSNISLKSRTRHTWTVGKLLYTATHTRPSNTQNERNVCYETFNRTFDENIKVIQNYPVNGAEKYLKHLDVNKLKPTQIKTFPVFVTAFDSSHYNESQGLFKNLHENFLFNTKYRQDVLIVAFDMGLTELEALMVKQYCKCKLRKFYFEKLPPHVRTLTTYAFKPIIVQKVLMEFGFVWWLDTSIRFTTDNIDLQIAYTKSNSILYTVSRHFKREVTLTKHTLNETFNYLHEDSCKFRPFHEVWSGTLLFHFDWITRAIVNAWAICALNKQCIAPTGSEYKMRCNLKENYDGRCHRFDQSAIGIILRRLFHNQDYPVENNLTQIFTIRRGERLNYFL